MQKVGSTLQRSAQEIGQRVSLPEVLVLIPEVGTTGTILTVLGWIEGLAKGDALCILFSVFFF